jgi:hypothetical protein
VVKPGYIKAASDMSELKVDVKFWKQNLFPKSQVVKRFNAIVGATMGRFSTCDAVDKRLRNAGDDYVTFMLEKK